MALPDVKEKWSAAITEVTIGAIAENGGTRESTVTVGGEKGLPYLRDEEAVGRRPVIAMDVLNMEPTEWPEVLKAPFGDALKDPASWAQKCVEFGAEMICLILDGCHPDRGDCPAEKAAEDVKAVLEAVKVPLIIWGCDDDEKDNELMPKVSQAAKGERCLLGCAKQENYKVITAVCQADDHCLITLSPLDINIAKQVNILVSEQEFPLDRVVIFPTTGALGYGMEYAYSIQERGRLAALSGDRMMLMPVLVDAGNEAWRAKEAKASDEEFPEWGIQEERGPMWETVTATTLLQAGSDIIRMRHPKAVTAVKKTIDALMGA